MPLAVPENNMSCMLVKLMTAALTIGLGYHLLYSHAIVSSSISDAIVSRQREHQTLEKKGSLPDVVNLLSLDAAENCDLFTGQWIPYPRGPAYTNDTCNLITSTQDCMKNGKPDMGFLYWRWKPYGCDLPTFDAEKFLSSMKDKYWAFIGDSLLGNQIHSLICLLSKIEEPIVVFKSPDWKSATWQFPTYNLTLASIWAPFLAKANVVKNEVGNYDIDLYLDALETNWTSQFHKFDYVMTSGGQWFYKTMFIWENNKIIGCHYCSGKSIKDFPPDYLYRRVLQLALEFMGASDHKPIVLFRTWNPSHFEYGEWYNGGVCNRTLPYKEGEYYGTEEDHVMRGVEVEEVEKAAAMGNGVNIKLMDVYHLSLLRPDGHPGPYMHYHPFEKKKGGPVQNDCLHWCLPGPVDTWNQILMEMAMNKEESLRSGF